MSEYSGMCIEIGGNLPKSLVIKFLGMIENELSDYSGPSTEPKLELALKGKSIAWRGSSNYGSCDKLKEFCRKNNLSYIHDSDSTSDSDGERYFWVPGMEQEDSVTISQQYEQIVARYNIEPILDFLLMCARNGDSAFPLMMNMESLEYVKEIVEAGLRQGPKKAYQMIEEKIKFYLPDEPVIPAFNIVEG
jgi:hypothetical protein